MVWMDDVDAPAEPELVVSASRGDAAAFERLVASYRGEMYAHCYRVLGSVQAAEVARILDTTPASVNSALQRARKAVDQRVPPTGQQAELAALGADGRRELVDAFVAA
jgi:RNA polymerase sigma-70 factor (ECF subfamily)